MARAISVPCPPPLRQRGLRLRPLSKLIVQGRAPEGWPLKTQERRRSSLCDGRRWANQTSTRRKKARMAGSVLTADRPVSRAVP
jgi:hypothetical protein